MSEDYRMLIQEWFANCITKEDTALLYAELLLEMRTQLNFMLSDPKESD